MATESVMAQDIARTRPISDQTWAITKAGERVDGFRWSALPRGESTLLPQARAVFSAMRGETDIEHAPAVGVDDPSALEDRADSRGGCEVMAIPGSRIIEERCYFPTEGEEALNDYQFTQEIRRIREQAERQQLQQSLARAQAEATEAAQPRLGSR